MLTDLRAGLVGIAIGSVCWGIVFCFYSFSCRRIIKLEKELRRDEVNDLLARWQKDINSMRMNGYHKADQ